MRLLPPNHGRRPCRNCARTCFVCMDQLGPADKSVDTGCHDVCRSCLERYLVTLREAPTWDGRLTCPCGSSDRPVKRFKFESPHIREPPNVVQRDPFELQSIVETVMLLRCPHCETVFHDFDGCAAVLCRCGQYFCGLCLQPCSNRENAHEHVAACRYNWSPGHYFVTQRTIFRAHQNLRALKLWKSVIQLNRERSFCYALYVTRELVRLGASPFPHGMFYMCTLICFYTLILLPRCTIFIAAAAVCW